MISTTPNMKAFTIVWLAVILLFSIFSTSYIEIPSAHVFSDVAMSTWRTKISVNTGTEWLADDLIIVTEVRHTPRSRTDVVAIDTMNSLIESEFPLQETQRLHYDLLQTLMDRNLAYIIEDKVVQNVRYLDKLIDELAKGKAMDKILRK